ncbi:hypothetical protein ACFLVC_00990 [Chloroflexota bacterium]
MAEENNEIGYQGTLSYKLIDEIFLRAISLDGYISDHCSADGGLSIQNISTH